MPAPSPPASWADKHVPFYNDASRAWGAINRILAIPCAPDPVVYIEAAVSGAWKAAVSIASPDPKEIYHQIIGNSLYHDIKQTGQNVKIFSNPETSAVTKTLFTIADIVDVAAWYMFLFSAGVNGLVDFSSQLAKYAGCQNKHDPNFFSGGPYINAIADDGALYADDFAGSTGAGTPVAGPAAFRYGNGFGGFAAASCQFATFGGLMPVPSITVIRSVQTLQIFDKGASNPNDVGQYRAGHAFFRSQGSTGFEDILEAASAYTGGNPLPLGEAFRDGNKWAGYSLTVHPG